MECENPNNRNLRKVVQGDAYWMEIKKKKRILMMRRVEIWHSFSVGMRGNNWTRFEKGF